MKSGGTSGLTGKKRGPAAKAKRSSREIQLEREKRALEKRLAKVEAIIEFQKKCTICWGSP
ncbi:MAG: hypothetical protein ACI8TQ_000415 [Planctomycetota bacterium]